MSHEVKYNKKVRAEQIRKTIVEREGKWTHINLLNSPDPDFSHVIDAFDDIRLTAFEGRDDIDLRTTRVTASGQALICSISVKRSVLLGALASLNNDCAREMHKQARIVLEKETPRQEDKKVNWLRTAKAGFWNAWNQAGESRAERLKVLQEMKILRETLEAKL